MFKLRIAFPLLGATIIAVTPAMAANTYSFQTINNSADPAFNQLLGINNSGTIAGYDGDGNVLPNKGYTVTPPYTQTKFTSENFPNSAQTQVVGINNGSTPTTVGFWADNAGNNFGFVNQNGSFTNIQNPGTPKSGTVQNQLLGVNDNNLAAGFFVDTNGMTEGYVYNIGSKTFTPIVYSGLNTTATGINNTGTVSGFYQDGAGADHGFIYSAGSFTTFNDPNGTNTMFLGLNNKGEVVGSYVDGNGETQGLVYDFLTNTWQTVSDPNSSANAAFNVTGTTVNGINDNGQLVGFYSDGTNVDGLLATATPEPASIALMSLGLVGAGLLRRRKRS